MEKPRHRSRAVMRELSLFLLAAVGIASLDKASSAAGVPVAEADFSPRRSWRDTVWRIYDRMVHATFSLAAAAVAYYAFLAIFPSVAALASVYGLITDPATVQGQVDALERFLPPEAAKLISDALHNFVLKNTSELNAALAISFVLTVWSARAGVAALMSALNVAFEATETRSFLAQQLTAVALTLAAIVVGICILLATSVVPVVLKLLPLEPDAQALVLWLRWPLLAVMVAIGFATVYRFAPCRPGAKWRITFGSITASALWIVGSSLFSLYISMSGSYDAIYGSLAAVVVLMLWLWVTALALLTGAVIDAERARPLA
ncbi:MAG: YihY/virulence factor BrkB family protein [Methylobacteriaceae bacterium]|nr:YihY/virulence factor BrkB family protein [Methylobacteriaceae bacterium]